jgi:hypothetical protein
LIVKWFIRLFDHDNRPTLSATFSQPGGSPTSSGGDQGMKTGQPQVLKDGQICKASFVPLREFRSSLREKVLALCLFCFELFALNFSMAIRSHVISFKYWESANRKCPPALLRNNSSKTLSRLLWSSFVSFLRSGSFLRVISQSLLNPHLDLPFDLMGWECKWNSVFYSKSRSPKLESFFFFFFRRASHL